MFNFVAQFFLFKGTRFRVNPLYFPDPASATHKSRSTWIKGSAKLIEFYERRKARDPERLYGRLKRGSVISGCGLVLNGLSLLGVEIEAAVMEEDPF
jgi:hypothetical protein